MHSDEREMNPVTMTIINPRKEYWPSRGSNQHSPVLKFCSLPTELWGSAQHYLLKQLGSTALSIKDGRNDKIYNSCCELLWRSQLLKNKRMLVLWSHKTGSWGRINIIKQYHIFPSHDTCIFFRVLTLPRGYINIKNSCGLIESGLHWEKILDFIFHFIYLNAHQSGVLWSLPDLINTYLKGEMGGGGGGATEGHCWHLWSLIYM